MKSYLKIILRAIILLCRGKRLWMECTCSSNFHARICDSPVVYLRSFSVLLTFTLVFRLLSVVTHYLLQTHHLHQLALFSLDNINSCIVVLCHSGLFMSSFCAHSSWLILLTAAKLQWLVAQVKLQWQQHQHQLQLLRPLQREHLKRKSACPLPTLPMRVCRVVPFLDVSVPLSVFMCADSVSLCVVWCSCVCSWCVMCVHSCVFRLVSCRVVCKQQTTNHKQRSTCWRCVNTHEKS